MNNSFMLLGMETDHGVSWFALLLMLLPLVLRVITDAYVILRLQEEVQHTLHTIITGVVMVLLSVVVWKIEPVRFLFQPFVLSWAFFWLFFDYALNLIRGKNILYIDEGTDGKSSAFDRMYLAIGWPGVLFAKLWFLLVGLGVYFFMSLITHG